MASLFFVECRPIGGHNKVNWNWNNRLAWWHTGFNRCMFWFSGLDDGVFALPFLLVCWCLKSAGQKRGLSAVLHEVQGRPIQTWISPDPMIISIWDIKPWKRGGGWIWLRYASGSTRRRCWDFPWTNPSCESCAFTTRVVLSLSTQGAGGWLGGWVVAVISGIQKRKCEWCWRNSRSLLLAKIFGGFSFLHLRFILSITIDKCFTCKDQNQMAFCSGGTRPKSPFTDWVKETKCGPWDHATSESWNHLFFLKVWFAVIAW